MSRSEHALDALRITHVYAATTVGTGIYRFEDQFAETTTQKLFGPGNGTFGNITINGSMNGLRRYLFGVWMASGMHAETRSGISIVMLGLDGATAQPYIYDFPTDTTNLAALDIRSIDGGGGKDSVCGDGICNGGEDVFSCGVDCCLPDLECL